MSINTDRLLLREFAEADFPAIHALLSCPRVMEFSPTGPLSSEQCRQRLDDFLGAYAVQGFGKWAVELKASREVIGYCGVELTAIDGPPVPELGFRIRAENWGCGYATEAARAAMDYCFRVLAFSDLFAFAEPANLRSIRVLAKLGFAFERSTRWLGHDVDVFRTTHATATHRSGIAPGK